MNCDTKTTRETNPRSEVNPLSALFFIHLWPLFRKSYKTGFKEEDLYKPLQEHESTFLGDKLEKALQNESTTLFWALVKMFGFEMMVIGIIHLLTEMVNLTLMPRALSGLVTYFGNQNTKVTDQEAYVYSGLIIVWVASYSIILHSVMMFMTHVGMKMRVACCALVYRKSLRLSQSALAQATVGQIVNILTNDVSKFDNGVLLLHYLWISPIQAVVGTYLLYRIIGVASFAGMAFLLLFVPIQIFIGKKNAQVRLKIAVRTDKRVHIMGEVLSGMQAIKMYTWEKPFSKLVSAARRFEIKAIRLHYYLDSIMYSLEMFVTRTCIFISIVIFIFLGNHILASTVYTVTLIYGIIRLNVTKLFSFSISRLGEILTTINRLQQFIKLDETCHTELNEVVKFSDFEKEPLLIRSNEEATKPKIILKSVDAKWCSKSSENTLTDITLNITDGQLVAVIGAVGSGKSSLINIILKEMPVSNGFLTTEGTISYACQEAWVFSGTVRQNILFGAPYEETRYRSVLSVCALDADLKLLPYGDQTIVGEKGNSLSGGQKARINLARCVYKRADIYLLDDPLSAVDTKVGRKLYDDCITHFLSNRIRILVTHQLQYLKNANKIIILNQGKIVGDGNFDELQNKGLNFSKLLKEFCNDEENPDEKQIKSRYGSEVSLNRYDEFEEADDPNKEMVESGKIKFTTYWKYLRSGGNIFVVASLVFLFVAAQTAGNSGDFFVRYWINLEQDQELENGINSANMSTLDRRTIMYTYTGITLATIIFAFVHSVFFFLFFMRASIKIHDLVFNQISHATMRFFNNNPVGRILNRFSKDIGIIDEYLPFVLIDVLQTALILFGTIIMTSIVNPWLLLPTIGLLVLFYFIRLVYVKTSRDVKRIEGTTRSPMFNHVTATLDGLSTIRAFAAQKALAKEFDAHQNLHSSAWYLSIASSRAFGLWIDMICTVFTSCLIVAFVVFCKDSFHGGDIGLILTQYLNFTWLLQWGMRMWSELENNMTSVERVLEYTTVETEPMRDAIQPPKKWPEYGKIVFENVSLRYSFDEGAVLKGLNFTINSGEKIGVVGRTGAGKSSTITALFQLYEIDGSIIIDNIDTTKIPLESLRSKVSIIPQIPVLFTGTIRKNLDPFEEYTDAVVWNALEEVEMKDVIESSGLSANVTEGGSNFSIGQRQLICLARAIIRRNKILVMDEATANIDPHTDELIQNTIRKKFAACTVITIAHRLHTVMDSNRILVMDAGKLVEFDHPHKLLQDIDSIFCSMVETTGKTTAHKLRALAEESYRKIQPTL